MSDYDDRFWAALAQVRTGLLAVDTDEGDVVAPMTAHFDGRGPLFFYAPADGVLVGHLDGTDPHHGRFLYTGPDHGLYAVVDATLAIEADAAIRACFWSDEVEAWFPGGPDHPGVAMIRCEPGEAKVWLGTAPAEAHRRGRKPRDRRATVEL